jgi:type IV pilus assembly protein PilW
MDRFDRHADVLDAYADLKPDMRASKQRGLSLVELMVSITIGLILLAGVISIFLSSKVTYFANEKTSRLQENGRVALDQVVHDVRSAGYMGCARAVPYTSTLNSPASLLWNYAVPLQGFESDGAGAWAPAIAVGLLNPAPIRDSDVLVTRAVQRDGRVLRVVSDLGALTSSPSVLDTTMVAPGMIMMITDCTASSVFQVTGFAAGAPNGSIEHATGGSAPGNLTEDLGYLYMAGARVAPLQTVIYYVANDPVSGEPSLYRQTGAAQPADQLIEGVQALQLAYAEDTNGDRVADVYRAASAVTNWDNVLSVSLSMLIRSVEQGSDVDAKTYQLLDATVGGRTLGPFNDRRMRMVFTTTIALRNRAL